MRSALSSKHLHFRDLSALWVERVDGAGEARVERVDRAQHFERLLRVNHGVADERRLVRPLRALCVARAGVPGCGDDGLIVLVMPVAYDDPVRERAARRFVEAEAAHLAPRELR